MTDPYCQECGVVKDLHVDLYCRLIREQKNALRERSHVLERYESALKRIRDCDFEYNGNWEEGMRAIAQEALK